ncbi:hypothetical protein C8Q80DRAFT_204322 [Daedaleopsis nitida]|nr:hypothetical protein C8Q80DRAFT_204322 [Daedaleopsis nitida]
MSLRCLRDPTLPILLPDEFESFSYAMLYNAIRFLLHNLNHIDGFVHAYFDDSPLDGDNHNSAPGGKEAMINAGKLFFGGVNVLFHDDKGNDNHPLNALMKALLEKFHARYNVLDWQANVEQQKKKEANAAQLLAKPSVTHDDTADDIDQFMDAIGVAPQGRPSSRSTGTVTRLPTATAQTAPSHDTVAIPRPPPADFEHAASLETHDTIIEIFESPLYSGKVNWPAPGHDLIGYDRLDGYRAPPRPVPRSTAQPVKQAKTVPDDEVLHHAPISVTVYNRGNKGKGVSRGRNRGRGPVSGR